jgi:hypothetical protein
MPTVLPYSSYLDFTSYGMTTATTVAEAYGQPLFDEIVRVRAGAVEFLVAAISVRHRPACRMSFRACM